MWRRDTLTTKPLKSTVLDQTQCQNLAHLTSTSLSGQCQMTKLDEFMEEIKILFHTILLKDQYWSFKNEDLKLELCLREKHLKGMRKAGEITGLEPAFPKGKGTPSQRPALRWDWQSFGSGVKAGWTLGVGLDLGTRVRSGLWLYSLFHSPFVFDYHSASYGSFLGSKREILGYWP